MAQKVKNLPAMRETWIRSLGWEDPLEEVVATHSNILAWKLPWTEEPGRLQSMGWQRVRHDWTQQSTLSCAGRVFRELRKFGRSLAVTCPDSGGKGGLGKRLLGVTPCIVEVEGEYPSLLHKVSWRRKWQLTPVFLPGKSLGQRSLAGYSLWGRRVWHNLATKQQQQKRNNKTCPWQIYSVPWQIYSED